MRRRPGQILAVAVSIALAVGFVASLGAFASRSQATLTKRAAAQVAVDWQVQVTPQGNPGRVATALHHVADVTAVLPVDYAKVASLSSTSGSGRRTTGQAWIVCLPPGYASQAPGQIRFLLGAHKGVLIQQQTAANLSAQVGSSISVATATGHSQTLRVDGVIDLPKADSFFQVVGTAPGTGATAPPDNVVIVPRAVFDSVSGPSVIHQFHVRFSRVHLPSDPAAAATAVAQRASHFEVQVAGGALVGDNLEAALSAARQDAIYARLLFLLLGLPGAVLAAVLASLVVGLRSEQRRRDIALLRMRGASSGELITLAGVEAALVGVVGSALGVPLAVLASRLALDGAPLSLPWTIAAVVGGVALAGAVLLAPIARVLRPGTYEQVAPAAARAISTRAPWPIRLNLDFILLAGAAVATYLAATNGYKVVVVPEGVPVTSVDYASLFGPALAWPGLAILVWRLSAAALGRRSGRYSRDRPGRAPELEAASIRRRRRIIARGAAGLAVAVGLAASTAIFTATYDAQSRLDVALTVGASVAVQEPPGSHVGPAAATRLAAAPGVTAVAPLQHRLVYVGPDLQDLYGINPARIAKVAPLRDSFVPGSNIHATLAALASHPDGVLLSAETLRDYQLHTGDTVRLRIQVAPAGRYQAVPFRVIGQVSEFPTAPKDSFIVANASYIARVTGSDAVGAFLIDSSSPTRTAAALRHQIGVTPAMPTGAAVSDIPEARGTVTTASGLAATDLAGLARLELGFGLVMSLGCAGLALGLGVTERRRALVLLGALGANARQRGRFIAAEGRALVLWGIAGGALIGGLIAYLLVKVLTGIFDPPPSGLSVPVAYLLVLGGSVSVLTALVGAILGRLAARAGPSQLRDL